MNFKQAEKYLLTRPEATNSYPFGPGVAIHRVKNKILALLGISGEKCKELDIEYADYPFLNLKCDPEESFVLRGIFPEVLPAYHMSKKHWVSVVLKESMPEKEIERLIDRSYGLVVKGLKKAERTQLELAYSPIVLYR